MTPYAAKFARLHLKGQNVTYFDGHVAWFHVNTPVACQLYPGYDETNYWTVPGNSWMWSSPVAPSW